MLFLGSPASGNGQRAYDMLIAFSTPDLVYPLPVCTEIVSLTRAASPRMSHGLKSNGVASTGDGNPGPRYPIQPGTRGAGCRGGSQTVTDKTDKGTARARICVGKAVTGFGLLNALGQKDRYGGRTVTTVS